MLVKYWMKRAIISVNVNDSMQEAISRMREYFVSLLPVYKNGSLVGVITDRDLKRASASDATSLEVHELAYLISQIKVGQIMSKPAITIPGDFTLEEAADLLLKNKISGAPVTDSQGRVVGLISQREIFRALTKLVGFEKQGVQLAMEIEDRPGSIKDITDVIRNYGGRLVSILTSFERAQPGHRLLYVRTFGVNREKLPIMIEEIGQKARLLYIVDHRENKRQEFFQRKEVA